ncbi:MAG: SDR family NAD(P)-dependent oxidoreductase [Deltaproteobacteria bacterium]|nr:MAG: SDR family NAD(P)-dependent oxidoreductase [Deltaproteobacteria bacterium]
MLKRAIIVGASSGIGAALARRLVSEGYKVGLVARRSEALDTLATRLNGDGPKRAFVCAHDVTDVDGARTAFEGLVTQLDGLDTLIYSAGIMPAVGPDEFDADKDRAIVSVNVIGAMAWLDLGAERFLKQGSGMLVGIGSVAGDRGRRGQPAYAASKAALHTFMEALRNRLAPKGVHVLTVKPGPTHTPMTEGLDKLPMAIDADQSADGIFRAMARRADTAYVPFQWMPIMAVIKSIPSVIFRRLPLD